jgi:hypothetical protein
VKEFKLPGDAVAMGFAVFLKEEFLVPPGQKKGMKLSSQQ